MVKFKTKISLNVVFAISFSGLAINALADGVELNIRQGNGNLLMEVRESGGQEVKMNVSFSMNPILGSIKLNVKKNGKLIPFHGTMNEPSASERSYAFIRDGVYFVGELDDATFNLMYNLSPGCYDVSFTYKDSSAKKFKAFDGEVESNSMKYCVN